MSTHSKVIARTDTYTHRHTDRQTDRQTDTHTHTYWHTHIHDENITSTAYVGGKNSSNLCIKNWIENVTQSKMFVHRINNLCSHFVLLLPIWVFSKLQMNFQIRQILSNLPKLPNSLKVKIPLKVSKFTISNCISFWNTLNVQVQSWVLGVKCKHFIKFWQICQIHLGKTQLKLNEKREDLWQRP